MKKVFKVLGILLIILLVGTGIMFSWFISQNNRAAGSKPVQYGQDSSEVRKALVVFQPSRSGITDRIAQGIAEGMAASGLFVLTDYPGAHLPGDLEEYDVVVFGTPVYVGRPSGVLLEYMERASFNDNQHVYLFSTGSVDDTPEWEAMEGSLAEKADVKDVRKFIGDQEQVLFIQAAEYGEEIAKATDER